MKTPAKIELGIKCCASTNVDKCTGCPYAGLHLGIGCKTILFRDVQDYLNAIKKSAARIEAMTKQLESAQPKWISVVERLPEESETVLAYRDGCCGVASLLDVEPEIMWTFTGFGGDPTHWMPLPEPPNEEE